MNYKLTFENPAGGDTVHAEEDEIQSFGAFLPDSYDGRLNYLQQEFATPQINKVVLIATDVDGNEVSITVERG